MHICVDITGSVGVSKEFNVARWFGYTKEDASLHSSMYLS